jgi:aryl-alcohol dehydrogenase-like predicted oxidoreductase
MLAVDGCLERLGTDWIDLFIVHREDPTTPLEETLVALHEVVVKLREIAGARSSSVPQVALAWLLAKEAATCLVLGASKMSHLQDNLGAIDVELAAEEVAALDEMMPPPPVYPSWFSSLTADAAHKEALGL